ncbi:hypothetical protein ACQKOE_10940 [Novosphingobium sp. NPDC080210]|uniref:hypothetical protein n=1 Tax=Novosphingobium sp. NPDC080210 TaxID=3390596 RepID=UPI003D03FD67
MATVKQNPATRSPWRRRILLLGLALVIALFAFFWKPLSGYAETGAAYGARVACSCRFVGGRPLGDCKKDFEPGMELITLSEDVESKSVTARFPLLARETATYREGPGCQLEPWDRK